MCSATGATLYQPTLPSLTGAGSLWPAGAVRWGSGIQALGQSHRGWQMFAALQPIPGALTLR